VKTFLQLSKICSSEEELIAILDAALSGIFDNRSIQLFEELGKYFAQLRRHKQTRRYELLPRGDRNYKNEFLSRSQIRQVYGKVKQIEAKSAQWDEQRLAEFLMLRPLIAYSCARAEVKSAQTFNEIFSHLVSAVASAQDMESRKRRFRYFAKIFEAILAFHRASGGS
jgi:CRISPR type III-A-associated protein Csm2